MQFDSFRMVKEGFYTNGISNHQATEKHLKQERNNNTLCH